MAILDRHNPKYLVTIGRTFYEMGRLKDALTAYQYAFKRFPKEPGLKERISNIESEYKEGSKDEKH
jgi:cytochrome c-type biogenesis protein CcmH/NrfG